MVMPLEVISTS